ncbi:hypothetical protein MMC18_007771 [Xylographa bjoerkii]|nr:hypothetical protein [Xylographa bjoerkii]
MNETVQFSYLRWQDEYLIEKPYQVFIPLPKGVPEERATNLKFALGEKETVKDIRGTDIKFTLNEHGFTTSVLDNASHTSSETEITTSYIPEICELVKKTANADSIVPFDWRIRKSVSPVKSEVINLNDNMIPLLPARHVHIGNRS